MGRRKGHKRGVAGGALCEPHPGLAHLVILRKSGGGTEWREEGGGGVGVRGE